MNLKKDNKIVVDLNKVQFARFYYRNQYGQVRDNLSNSFSVRGESISPVELALFHPDYPGESVLARAFRLRLVDIWQSELLLKLSANHCLIYTGEKAISLWKAWNKKIFSKQKSNS